MNNGITMMDDPPESHEDGRRIGDVNINETVTTHHHGSRALHETRGGRDNFSIIGMMDKHGNSKKEGIIKMTQVWHNDRQSRFQLEASGKDFWLRNATTCERFCGRNRINPKHWKRTEEAGTHKLRNLTNTQNDQNNEEEETAM